MSKRLVLIRLLSVLLLLLIIAPLSAQTSVSGSFAFDTAGIHVVQINIPGTLTLRSIAGPVIIGNTTLQASGHTWGWSNQEDAPFIRLKTFTRHDTLFLEAPERKLWVIGYSSYTEKLETVIDIPRQLVANVNGVQNMIIAGDIKRLTAKCSQRISVSCSTRQVGRLYCQAQRMSVNEQKRSPDYQYQGPGMSEFNLFASNINCNLY